MNLFPGFELLTFRFARTMPEVPHEYTVRQTSEPTANAAYDQLFERIQSEGLRELSPPRPGKKRYRNRYWYPGDGFKYWAMTTRIELSQIINRTALAYYDDDNAPLPELAAWARRAAPLIARLPAEERRTVTLERAILIGQEGGEEAGE